ncbi:hypothetical protein HDV06_004891 [Boothiomyces sp. JEL0866]|nr:hypothetical protein HDV06_004891 [Boothiomyces sp. JEL0866]
MKRIQFQSHPTIFETYSNQDYDRTSCQETKVTYQIAYEIMKLRNELKHDYKRKDSAIDLTVE